MKVLIVGATGKIGTAVTRLLESKGHEVVEASRSTQPDLDMLDTSSIESFYQNLGEVDSIISTAGDAAFASLDALTDEHIATTVNSKLLGQINLVRKGLSNLRAGGVIIITGGMLAYSPWPQTSLVAMVNAGLEGFAKAAALDLTEGRRIVIVHPPLIAETAAQMGMDTAPWPPADKAAEAYLKALEGDMSGKPVF
ncbi:MAG: short chain dehydrogenase, partial [Ferruginibacter sp.]